MAVMKRTVRKARSAGRVGASPTSSFPLDIAMAAEAGDTAADSPARQLLMRQERLVRWQTASERASLALKLLTALAGLAVASALAGVAWDASRSKSLVIDVFSTPPDLAQQGLTGQVIASRILDRMKEIQSGVDSQRAPSSFARSWDGEIKVEIPQTGVSLSELQRELHNTLGHDTHISGELVRTAGDLALTVRTGERSGVTFTAPEGQIDGLIRRGADAAFERTQPYRYSVFLRRFDLAESDRVLEDMARRGSTNDRAWAYLGLGVNAKDKLGTQAALPLEKVAEDLAPTLAPASQNIGFYELEIGHPEVARAAFLRSGRTASAGGQVRADLIEPFRMRLQGALGMIAGDYEAADNAWARATAFGPQGLNLSIAAHRAMSRVGLHEIAVARTNLTRPDPTNPRPTGTTATDVLEATVAADLADEAWVSALADGAKAEAILQRAPGAREQQRTRIDPLVAYAMARSGDVAGGQALIATTPLDSYDAVVMRGRIAELGGDHRLADHWFGQAVKLAPAIGFAPAEWAKVLLARGDIAGAIGRARQAHSNAPRFADPLEVWGEALLVKRDVRGALAKFSEAEKSAPRWGRNQLLWGEALASLGETNAARGRWARAARMDLTPADRATLEALLKQKLS